MESVFTMDMLNNLMYAMTVSIIVMATIQKFKTLRCINKECHVFLLNLILSFVVGIAFSMTFYNVDFLHAIWVSMFSFIGAPTIYEALKKQNVINLELKTLDNKDSEKKDDNNV